VRSGSNESGHRRGASLLSLLVVSLALPLLLGGCANVKAWEKGAFARPDMAWDPDPMGAALDAHIRFSKEGALPSAGGGGGGCGCN